MERRLSQAHVEKRVQSEAAVSAAFCGGSRLLTFTEERRRIPLFPSGSVLSFGCFPALSLSPFCSSFHLSSRFSPSYPSLPAPPALLCFRFCVPLSRKNQDVFTQANRQSKCFLQFNFIFSVVTMLCLRSG